MWLTVIFIFIGSINLVIGIIALFRRIDFIKRSVIIEGKVIGIKKGYVNKQVTYFPIVQYKDDIEGEVSSFQSDAGYNPSKYKEGDIINLRYLNNYGESKVCIDTWFAKWGVSFLFTIVGGMFTVIGIFMAICIK